MPEHLPVIEEVIEPEPVKQKPEDWRYIGQEVSEQLDYEPGRFLRRRTIRRKYVHRTKVDAVPGRMYFPAAMRINIPRSVSGPNPITVVSVIQGTS